jgi:hypothetical protein
VPAVAVVAIDLSRRALDRPIHQLGRYPYGAVLHQAAAGMSQHLPGPRRVDPHPRFTQKPQGPGVHPISLLLVKEREVGLCLTHLRSGPNTDRDCLG